jgi:hypothetical protein
VESRLKKEDMKAEGDSVVRGEPVGRREDDRGRSI